MQKISPKVVNPRDKAWNTEVEENTVIRKSFREWNQNPC